MFFAHRPSNESGFTLAELLVVIAIIAVLTSITLPLLVSQRGKARDTATRADMRAVFQEIETMLVDAPKEESEITVTATVGKVTLEVEGLNTTSVVLLSPETVIAADPTSPMTRNHYRILASNPSGKFYTSDHPLIYDSTLGGFTSEGDD